MLSNRLFRYFIIGVTSYVIEMSTLYVLHEIIGASAILSVGISFWVGFIVAFILQKLITFRNFDRQVRSIGRQVAGYSVLVAWNYSFTLLMTKLLLPNTSVYVARSLVILLITSWNYIIYRTLFKKNN